MIWGGKKVAIAAKDAGLREKAPAASFFAAMAGARWGRRPLVDWILCRSAPEPAPSQRGLVEDAEEDKLGICCSGGGIRSAAFCLGALQELEEEGELRRASYLAAVSGGSYIAAAISMVAKTNEGDSEEDSDPTLFGRVGPFEHGSPEEQYLRNRASYLAPTLMDKLYLGWRVVLGLLVNLAFISLPLIALALIFAGFVLAPFLPELAGPCTHNMGVCAKHAQLNLPAGFVLAPVLSLGLGVLSGLASMLPRWHHEGVERFFSFWSVRLLILAAALALFLVALPYLIELMREQGHNSANSIAVHRAREIGGATLALLAGVLVQLGHIVNSKSAQEDLSRARKLFAKLGKAARQFVTYAAAAVVGPLLLFGIFVLAAGAAMPETRTDGHVDMAVVGVGLAVLAAFGLIYEYADLTTWSLNPYYKRRLSTAFALKRVRVDAKCLAEDGGRFELRSQAAEDDVGIAVERDFDKPIPISQTALLGGEGKEWPTLLICAAANVSDSAATPPGRAVTSFTFSAETVGGPLVGAVGMEEMETVFDDVKKQGRRRDLTLPAAMAMSGAAISPSMGKMTRRPLTFLMALANIRLGVWVPNPRWIEQLKRDEHLRERNARPRPLYLLWELLGLNRIGAKYLYITDGGHYENLGLVELLRRGCTKVYCLDASGVGHDGAEFGALGEAIALARSELGVEIEFDPAREEKDPTQLLPAGADQFAKRDVVSATITYPKRPDGSRPADGTLVYVRNTMTDAAPWDVRAHHETDHRFPNDPTIDQLYTDQKFEAYRVLGARAGVNAVKRMEAA